MKIPRSLWRFSTGEDQDKLAERFDLPNEDWMQDWEYMISDPERINEFLAAYESGELSDDERFSLMEVILNSFSCLEEVEECSARWI